MSDRLYPSSQPKLAHGLGLAVGLSLVALSASAMALPLAAIQTETSASQPALNSSTTAHHITLKGVAVHYEAIVTETLIALPATTEPATTETATFVSTTYTRLGVPAQDRPVIFIFNGGPGASTTPLHFGAFGPMRRFGEDGDQYLMENPHSLLDQADLVFIDPTGTGYSRPNGDAPAFWTRTGDAHSVATFIQTWLSQHGREASPRYVLGQSYGTIRAAEITRVAPELKLNGILLFALVPGERSGPLAYMTSIPSYAATAWTHNRIDRAGRSVEQVYEEAIVFAREHYLPALVQGGALPAAEKAHVAKGLSALTGLSETLLVEHDLKIDNRLFMLNLLADQNLRTGQLDTRATRALNAPAQRPPYDDPGLGYSPETSVRLISDTDRVFRASNGTSVVDAYYADVLRYQGPYAYKALNLDVNSAWDHEDFPDAMVSLSAAMKRDENLRVFWVAGYFDLSTPAYAGRYTLDQAGIPADRLTPAYFASGHSVFVEGTNLGRLATEVRQFITP